MCEKKVLARPFLLKGNVDGSYIVCQTKMNVDDTFEGVFIFGYLGDTSIDDITLSQATEQIEWFQCENSLFNISLSQAITFNRDLMTRNRTTNPVRATAQLLSTNPGYQNRKSFIKHIGNKSRDSVRKYHHPTYRKCIVMFLKHWNKMNPTSYRGAKRERSWRKLKIQTIDKHIRQL